jgi:membrane protein DedA with SNARE-associated domain
VAQFVANVLAFLSNFGVFGIALGLMIEVIPSEIVLAYGGYLISQGIVSYPGAVLAGVTGGLLSQLFLYWAGYFGGRPFLLRYGKYVLIKEKHVDLAQKWFDRYGPGVIFGARFIPVVRHAISIPAGIAKMSGLKFSLYTTLAIIPWTFLFLEMGRRLGSNWKTIKEAMSPYVMPLAVVGVILGLVYMMVKRKKAGK